MLGVLLEVGDTTEACNNNGLAVVTRQYVRAVVRHVDVVCVSYSNSCTGSSCKGVPRSTLSMALVAGSVYAHLSSCSRWPRTTRSNCCDLTSNGRQLLPGKQPRRAAEVRSTNLPAVKAKTGIRIANSTETCTKQRKTRHSTTSAAAAPSPAWQHPSSGRPIAPAAGTPDRTQQQKPQQDTKPHQQRGETRRQQGLNSHSLQPLQQDVQLLPLPSGNASSTWAPLKQQQQQTLLPHPFCTLDHKVLTHRIKQCLGWHDAAVLFAQQSQCMNYINLAALITHLAQMRSSSRCRPVNWRSLVAQVLAASEPHLKHCSPRQLSNMVWGLATLGYSVWTNPGNGWTGLWQQQLQQQLHTTSCRDISNILWAAATTVSSTKSDNSSSSSGWPCGSRRQPLVVQEQQHFFSCQRLQQELLSALHRELPNSTPQDVSNSLWALATLNLTPSPELQQFLLIRVQAHSSHLKPQEVAQSLWALAQLGVQPPAELVRELLLKQISHEAAVSDISSGRQGIWRSPTADGGSSRLQQVVDKHGSSVLVSEPQQVRQLPSPGPSVRHSVKQRQEQQQHQQREPRQQRQQQQAGVASETNPQNLVICLVACAQLKQMPPDKWLQQALVQLEVLLLQDGSRSSSNDRRCSAASNGSAGASTTPADSSSTEGGATSNTSGSVQSSGSSGNSNSSTSQDLANVIWALGSLGIKPKAAWMDRYLAASCKLLHTAKPQELCNMLWGVARLNITPSPSWLQGYDNASSACMWGFTAQGLGDVLAAQVYLGSEPSGVWKEAWMQGLRACWGSADAAAVCKTLWAAARFQLPLGRHWLQEALLQAHEELQRALVHQELTYEEFLRLVWAVGKLSRGALHQSVSDMLGLHCCRAAAKMSWQQLQRAARGLRKLKPLPRQQLLCYFCDLAESRMRYMPAEQAESVARYVQLLRDASDRQQLKKQQQQQQQRVQLQQPWEHVLRQQSWQRQTEQEGTLVAGNSRCSTLR